MTPRTAGEEALREAARLETARVYSQTCPEYRSVDGWVDNSRGPVDGARRNHAGRSKSDQPVIPVVTHLSDHRKKNAS